MARNYAAELAARNAKAQSQGFSSYGQKRYAEKVMAQSPTWQRYFPNKGPNDFPKGSTIPGDFYKLIKEWRKTGDRPSRNDDDLAELHAKMSDYLDDSYEDDSVYDAFLSGPAEAA